VVAGLIGSWRGEECRANISHQLLQLLRCLIWHISGSITVATCPDDQGAYRIDVTPPSGNTLFERYWSAFGSAYYMDNLNGTIVALTGAFGNLGLATAQVLADRGAKVALIGRGRPPSNLPAPLAQACVVGGVDLAERDAAQRAIDSIANQLGGLNALVNVAGGFSWETVADGSADTWERMFDVNVKTTLNASKAALHQLTKSSGGRIVSIGAMAALKAGMGMGAYAASKAGVMRLTEALAEEVRGKGATVNAILPNIIDTPQNRADMPDADFTLWVTPEKVAAVIAFLLSKEAQCITGALIPVG
jgi:NAD(P)-dependent dehydrogenase (short-subunit alcohol dehydrogenase family)